MPYSHRTVTKTEKSPRRILIVEDNQSIAETLQQFFLSEGYVVSLAGDGGQAIQALQTATPPDVILLDMMMPGVNGWHFLDYQRSHEQFASIPVVVVSAFGEIAKSVHPDAYLSKPFDLEVLLETVEKLSA